MKRRTWPVWVVERQRRDGSWRPEVPLQTRRGAQAMLRVLQRNWSSSVYRIRRYVREERT
jgi:hypothetical protein